MTSIDLGEVFYVVKGVQGEQEALETLRDLRSTLDLDLPSQRVIEPYCAWSTAGRGAG